jgi:thiol-disulfide isomerase/thioredoxin
VKRRLITWAVAAIVVVIGANVIVHLTAGKKGLPDVGAVIPVAQRPAAPVIEGSTLTGSHLNVASLRGHTVVLNFWGSWCAPCQAEAPVLAKVSAQTAGLGVRFVGIDVRDNNDAGLAFEQAHHITYPSISDPNSLIAVSFGADAPDSTPSTYILDSRGRIAWANFGATTYNQLELAVVDVAHG